MEHELRKVKFSLNYPQGFFPDEKEQFVVEELARDRNGLFHGKTEIVEGELKICKFVIKDEDTGEVHLVDPQLVKFVN